MYILLGVCENPGFLRVLYFISIILDFIFTIVPIGMIVMLLIDFAKSVFKPDEFSSNVNVKNVISRIVSAVLLFAVPWIITVFMNIMDRVGWQSDFTNCWSTAKSGNFTAYDAKYNQEIVEISKEKQRTQAANIERARQLEQIRIESRKELVKSSGSESVNITGTSTNKNFETGSGTNTSNEPSNPLTPLSNLYDSLKNEIYNPSNFTPMKDKDSGYSLGAWPKDANVSNLSGNLTTYQNKNLIYPITGNGYDSYNHNGIDIVTSKPGTPIYAPADGTITYSEWGHTLNRGPRETAYSVSIKLDTPFKYNGLWSNSYVEDNTGVKRNDTVTTIFLTHMVGIKNRIGSGVGSQIKVKKGELIGFNGVAADVSHVHITFYNESQSYGLHTKSIRNIYNLTKSETKEAGK